MCRNRKDDYDTVMQKDNSNLRNRTEDFTESGRTETKPNNKKKSFFCVTLSILTVTSMGLLQLAALFLFIFSHINRSFCHILNHAKG